MTQPTLLMPEAVLSRSAEELAAKFEGVFSRQTVERYVFESYTALRRTARVTNHLTALAHRFAADRLTALAQAQGAVFKDVPEVLFICVHNAGRPTWPVGRGGAPDPRRPGCAGASPADRADPARQHRIGERMS